jgi:hypothetical protein
VDGVLNALQLDLPEGWRRGLFNGYVLSWDPTVTARLRAWHDSGRVEIQWLTSWTEDADRLLAEPMGLPRGLRTHTRDSAAPAGYAAASWGPAGWWKLAHAREVAEAEPGRRIVWIDDDLADATLAGDWVLANQQVMVVAPELVTGLTHAELDVVEAWL